MKVRLIEILEELCVEIGDTTFSKLGMMLLHSRRLMTQLGNMGDTGSTLGYVKIKRDPKTRLINLPKDFVKAYKVGFIHNGNLIGLGHNPKMAPLDVDDCGEIIPIEGGNSKGQPAGFEDAPPTAGWNYGEDGFPLGYTGWAGGYGAGQWGVTFYGAAKGWSQSGYFRVDTDSWTIQFSSDTLLDEVWLKYQSNGFSDNSVTWVLEQWADVIKNGVMVRMTMHNQSTNADRGQYELYKREFAAAKTRAISATHGSTLAEVVDVFRQTSGGAPRS